MAKPPVTKSVPKAFQKQEPLLGPWVTSVANDHKPLLLLIDDDKILLKAFERRFKDAGFDVAILHAGSESLRDVSQLGEKLNELHPQAIITDNDMGVFDGVAVMQTVKSLHPELPVYLLSGNDVALRAARQSNDSSQFDGAFDKADTHPIPDIIDTLSKRGIVPNTIQRAPGS